MASQPNPTQKYQGLMISHGFSDNKARYLKATYFSGFGYVKTKGARWTQSFPNRLWHLVIPQLDQFALQATMDLRKKNPQNFLEENINR